MYVYKKEVEKEEIIDSLGNGEREKALRFLLSVTLSVFSTFHIFFLFPFLSQQSIRALGNGWCRSQVLFLFHLWLERKRKGQKGEKRRIRSIGKYFLSFSSFVVFFSFKLGSSERTRLGFFQKKAPCFSKSWVSLLRKRLVSFSNLNLCCCCCCLAGKKSAVWKTGETETNGRSREKKVLETYLFLSFFWSRKVTARLSWLKLAVIESVGAWLACWVMVSLCKDPGGKKRKLSLYNDVKLFSPLKRYLLAKGRRKTAAWMQQQQQQLCNIIILRCKKKTSSKNRSENTGPANLPKAFSDYMHMSLNFS